MIFYKTQHLKPPETETNARPVIKKDVFLLFHFYGVIAFWKQTLPL